MWTNFKWPSGALLFAGRPGTEATSWHNLGTWWSQTIEDARGRWLGFGGHSGSKNLAVRATWCVHPKRSLHRARPLFYTPHRPRNLDNRIIAMESVVPRQVTVELTQILSNLVLGDNEIRSRQVSVRSFNPSSFSEHTFVIVQRKLSTIDWNKLQTCIY